MMWNLSVARQISWFNSKGYLQGIFWMVMVCVVSSFNDTITKYVGTRLSGAEVAFFRFFFSTLVLLPFMAWRGKGAFVTHYPKAQCIRAVLLVLAMTAWSYGVASLPLTLATIISFTTPFFILPLAKIFLKEHVGWQRWAATLFGFLGILISIQPIGTAFNPMAFALIASTVMFASLDVINKRLLTDDESLLCMLFYSGLGTAVLGLIPAVLTWQMPTLSELLFLLLLGTGGSMILFCLLKAFAATEVSALQSFRYTEFILSAVFGLLIFKEWPAVSTLFGAAIIIPATFYIAVYETRQKRKKREREELELKKVAA
ncbi:MAG TPA: EamA family transporter [Holosporales bacterium]|nr:EamA family transporter [Holosporales bacterium]HCE95328.1 EamA family transporter [Holosporales bacterium]